MTCSGCQSDNASDRRFCGACGKSLTKTCPRCDFRNGLGDRYCGGCGEPLALTVRPTVRIGGARPQPPVLGPATAAEAPVLVSANGEELPQISPQELAELMRKKPNLSPAPPSLSAKVSQDDLDKLFGTRG